MRGIHANGFASWLDGVTAVLAIEFIPGWAGA
jgi:hypothetical protein